tara:strand:- start:1861 stop:2607 length:747 start_codon:yes stop_codon:yes gene_type:complete
MENWQRYLHEGKLNDKDYALMVQPGMDDSYTAVLYRRGETEDDPPMVVGMVYMDLLSDDENPCIPRTYEINNIARAGDYGGQGIGELLYQFAGTIAKIKGAGITSDHGHSTSVKAGAVWDKIGKSPNYRKRKTKDGHDTFDYDNSTEDPDDDCVYPSGYGGTAEVATDHSFMLKKIPPEYSAFIENHEYDKGRLLDPDAMEYYEAKLSAAGFDLFEKEYNKKDVEVMRRKAIPWWKELLAKVGIKWNQ